MGRTNAEAEAPILWPPDAKNWHIWKYPDAGKNWRQEEKGTTKDEMVEWHHQLDGHEVEWTLGVGDYREAWHVAIHGVPKSQTGQSNWTVLYWTLFSPYLFNFYAENIKQNVGLNELQIENKFVRRNINNLRDVDDTALMAENEEALKGLLMKIERGE